MNIKKIVVIGLFAGLISSSSAQTGSIYEPVRYIGGEIANPNVHDGGLRYWWELRIFSWSGQTGRIRKKRTGLAILIIMHLTWLTGIIPFICNI